MTSPNDEVKGDLTFTVKVSLRLDEDEVRKVLDGRRRWEENPRDGNDHFDALVQIFDEDTDLWEAYYVAAFDALEKAYPLKKKKDKTA